MHTAYARPALDAALLSVLVSKMTNRRPRSKRATVYPVTREPLRILRDPRDVAFRYLRRFAGGVWFRGGNHVARLHFGQGIGFLNFRNDRADPIRPVKL